MQGSQIEIPKYARHVDYDIHGLVGIRLVNPPPRAEAAINLQLGSLRQPLLRDPDIIIRFTKRLATPGLRLLGQNRFGFTDHGFFLMGCPSSRAKVRIPFDQIGNRCDIFCEEGISEVPLLMDILKIYALKKDCTPVHASAFIHNGHGVLVTSWAKGGKTTALLGFAALGAEFVGDDCIFLSGDGRMMYGLPTPVELSDWQLRTIPDLHHRIGNVSRFRKISLMGLRKIQTVIAGRRPGDSLVARSLQKGMAAIQRRASLRVSPEWAFRNQLSLRAPAPDKCFVLMNSQASSVEVEPACTSDTILRLAAGAREEQKPLEEAYQAFRFAFPGKPNHLIEGARQLQLSILERALGQKDSYIVRHPYPVYFPALQDAVRDFFGGMANPRAEGAPQTADLQTSSALTSAVIKETVGSI